jgi:glycosyltransferase involved in cell wall biosynthesis
MRIAMLAPPWLPVPPSAYGGIECVVALLADALVAAGHDVDLFSAPGSRSDANVRSLLDAPHPGSIGQSLFEADHVARAFAAIDAEARAGAPYDVVHDHTAHIALAMADRLGAPVVHTVHCPFDEDASAFYRRHGAKASLVCISRAQAADAPPGVAVEGVVSNPIELQAGCAVRLRARGYLLWIGRVHPVKGPHRAIEVARAAGVPLVLAGPVQRGYGDFFRSEIEPHVDGHRVRYVGEVGGARKRRLFAEARALLMPIRWPEPFGMVMVEALAAGTPVLAFPSGAAPEIVDHGVTGFLVDDEQEMARMVAAVADLDPERCRARAAEQWAPDRVAAAYATVYRRVKTGVGVHRIASAA